MQALTLPLIFSLVTVVISAFFAFVVLKRWRAALAEGKPRPYLRAWGIGLSLYTLGALCQVILSFTWSPLLFMLWYWTGALVVAPWLGQGTTYLLWRKGNIARNLEMVLLLLSIMTLPWALFLTPFTPDAASYWHPGIDLNTIVGQVLERGGVRAFVPVLNVWGTVALVGGAIYSGMLFRRKDILRERMVGNWLIAAGGLLPALGGTALRLGITYFNYFGIMIGVILIYLGFQKTANARDEATATRQPRPSAENPAPRTAGN